MPFERYLRNSRKPVIGPRDWPDGAATRAPLWCSVDLRDGNQSLPSPMDVARKQAMFDLLVGMGFKEIEVGYPAASEADFTFVQKLIRDDAVPDDVTISIFTPARKELIDRSFESLQGSRKAIVHLCMATACLWRDVVFGLTPEKLIEVVLEAARHVADRADEMNCPGIRFEYSPETFNVTEPELVLDIASRIGSVWDACSDRPVVLNLPSTVETDSPSVYADQVELVHRNLPNRENYILSVHPHNDRGTAVASAEFALMAGADRVEGTLFGNGERTGNVCLATLAMNLFSSGIDPQLDFSDIDGIRSLVELCNRIPVHPRHPYAGDLVYTAFSGTHQDAISKGLAALEERSLRAGQPSGEIGWEVPYLPIDPKDVGRTYESVVRVNSQSGKGGVAHVILANYGLNLPRGLRVEFSQRVQAAADESGEELNSRQLWRLFQQEYLQGGARDVVQDSRDGVIHIAAAILADDEEIIQLDGEGQTVTYAVNEALRKAQIPGQLVHVTSQALEKPSGPHCAGYAEMAGCGFSSWGMAFEAAETPAMLGAAMSAVTRFIRSRRAKS